MAEENNNIEVSKDGYLKLVQRIFGQKLEERELALDRYRVADEQMENSEQFVLMGRNAVSFLELASKSTNDLAALAKEIKSIVYKDEMASDVNMSLSSDWKSLITKEIEKKEKEEEEEDNE